MCIYDFVLGYTLLVTSAFSLGNGIKVMVLTRLPVLLSKYITWDIHSVLRLIFS